MKRIILYIVFLALGLSLQASTLTDAQKAYNAKEYLKAVELYHTALSQGGGSSELYYNLGNAYYGAGNFGACVLNYRKALKWDPLNSQAASNLEFVTSKVALANEAAMSNKSLDPTPQAPGFFASLRSHAEAWGSNFWAVTAAVFFLLFVAALVVYLFHPKVGVKKIGFFSSIVILLLSMGSLMLSFSAKSSAQDVNQCVLMASDTPLRASMSTSAKVVGEPLTSGTTFRLLQTRKDSHGDSWVNVYLNPDFSGWLPADVVEVVAL